MPYLNLGTKKKRIKQDNRKERMKVYQSTEWANLRKSKLMEQPLCEIHLIADRIVPAEDVHHKDSFMRYQGLERTDKAFDYDNLMSICKDCHGKIHGGYTIEEILDEIKNPRKNKET